MSSMNFYFKKTMRGMVLMKKNRYPTGYPGDWDIKWEKATEKESQEFLNNYMRLRGYEELIGEIKKTNPELLI
jgi:hypothetical protein